MLLLLLVAGAVSAAAQTVTVSADGPMRTLTAARDAARSIHAKTPNAAVRIEIRAGTYYLSETLVLGPEDSNTVWEAAPGGRVTVSGGRIIRGWAKGPGGVWTARAGEPYFRQLFVSGRRAQRARTPNFGFFRIDGPSPQEGPFKLKYRGEDIKPAWAGTDAEVVALLAWADLRMPIVGVDPAAHVATLTGEPRKSNRETDARYYIENAPEALDTAGEWRLDHETGIVSYRPVAGEDLTREEVVAPALTLLVKLEGRPEQGELVRGVVFRGIHFAHADWTMGPKGYADTQAAVETAQTAFEAVGAEECAVERCVFRQIGGYAVWFGRGCKRNRIVANEIADAGGGGVKIGETVQRANDAERNWEHGVSDNHIHDIGLVFPPAIGVWVGQSSRNTIAHNHIHDLYYTAISVGWTWGYGPNQCKGNIIEYNHLHSIGKDMLSDMGGIYTLGMQPGSVIRNNLIHDISSFTYGGWGIYPDEGSTEMVIENNVVYRCKSAGFHQHYGRENIVRNNIFALNRENQLMRTRAEPHLSFTFTGNIVYFDQGRLLGSNWSGDQFKMERNLYFDARSDDVGFAGKSLAEWQESGQDRESIIADPLFVNPASFDFRLRPGSPAAKIGFKEIDLSRVGPRVRQ
jgi:hypothetical protein